MAQEITLFDLPSTPPNKAWSYNPWKTRLVLNFKSIPYKTHWLELPDIAPHLKSLGVPPKPEGTPYTIPTILTQSPPPYTIPTIHLPSSGSQSENEYIVDSKVIAHALEARYPDPPLHLDAPQLAKAEELWSQASKALLGVFGPAVVHTLLNEPSKEFMLAKVDLDSLVGGDEVWEAAKPILTAIGALVKEKGGPFILGDTASYADFVLVSGMHAFGRADSKILEKWVEIEPACGRLYDASKQWLERDD
ncbi:MAG: hypothetical protein Q9221_003316 [Calogaya cf. arnoldii]